MGKNYHIKRYPASSNKSLKAWSAADELVYHHSMDYLKNDASLAVINDRFGYLSVHLSEHHPEILCHYKSQEYAVLQNLEQNGVSSNQFKLTLLTEQTSTKYPLVVARIPKSLDLFQLFLKKASALMTPDAVLLCGFMTRHFTPQILTLSSIYFEVAEQSRAYKKARVLLLKRPKKEVDLSYPIHEIEFRNKADNEYTYRQYFGVFSSRHIDYATQFLLENLQLKKEQQTILDLASGNGVIAHQIRQQKPNAEIHLMDDALLAIESSKLNLDSNNTYFHYNFNLDHFDPSLFDLVVCNPPFHFEHENTIEIALSLFKGVQSVLKENGVFLLVANVHLNYRTHLNRFFSTVNVLAKNNKFEVLECSNALFS